jgi:hypothetical protein
MICGSDHTASVWNAKIGVPRHAPKSLRPSDKLTPNPSSGSDALLDGEHVRWREALIRHYRRMAQHSEEDYPDNE